MVLFFTHIPFVENHTINATPPERLQQYKSICLSNFRRNHPLPFFIHCQARNQGGLPPLKIFHLSWKICWTKIKTITHSSKNLAPLRKLFTPSGVPSWLRDYSLRNHILMQTFFGMVFDWICTPLVLTGIPNKMNNF